LQYDAPRRNRKRGGKEEEGINFLARRRALSRAAARAAAAGCAAAECASRAC